MGSNIREVKCQAARGVIDTLKGAKDVEVLYLESFVLDRWLPWGTQFSDDLQVLIQHGKIDRFMDAMEEGRYLPALYDQQAGGCRTLTREEATKAVLEIPVSPEPFYVHRDWMSETGQPDLLVRFHTTTRHARLMLAHLDDWFRERDRKRDRSTVMGGTAYETEVDRPPLWAMMLWQAGEIVNHASDCVITKEEVDKLHLVAAHQIDDDWDKVLAKAERYGHEYDERIKCPAASKLLEHYGECLRIDAAKAQRAETKYGALYDLSHAIKALIDYGQPYSIAVPRRVWEYFGRFMEERPRKLWWYPGGQEDVPLPEARGRLGIAKPDFGIHAQIEEHPGADFDYLLRHQLVESEPLISNAPPHGPWFYSKEAEVEAILSFPVS
jgi:hypothetical protein